MWIEWIALSTNEFRCISHWFIFTISMLTVILLLTNHSHTHTENSLSLFACFHYFLLVYISVCVNLTSISFSRWFGQIHLVQPIAKSNQIQLHVAWANIFGSASQFSQNYTQANWFIWIYLNLSGHRMNTEKNSKSIRKITQNIVTFKYTVHCVANTNMYFWWAKNNRARFGVIAVFDMAFGIHSTVWTVPAHTCGLVSILIKWIEQKQKNSFSLLHVSGLMHLSFFFASLGQHKLQLATLLMEMSG